MAQSRVTNYFSQRKKSSVDRTTQRKTETRPTGVFVDDGLSGITTAPTCVSKHKTRSKDKDWLKQPSSRVHQDFVRLIEEVTEADRQDAEADTSLGLDAVHIPASPRTPKRTSVDAGLEAAVLSATSDHSTAKKRRQVDHDAKDAKEDDKRATKQPEKKSARKKLILCQKAEETTAQCSVIDSPTSRVIQTIKEPNSPKHVTKSQRSLKQAGRLDCKAFSKEDLGALKSQIRTIKKRAENLAGASAAAVTPLTGDAAAPKRVPPTNDDVLKTRVARAKELSAKTTKTKREGESKEDGGQAETQSHNVSPVPAYQRYHALAQDEAPGLTLPYQYKLLSEMFRSADTIVSMLYNRAETATFAKVKQGVQDMMHKRFEESHLGQIKAVYPSAYTFRQEKNIPTFNCNIKKGSSQLTLEPIINSDQREARPLLTASHLLERRRVFRQNLVYIIKRHHKAFLASLVPALSVPDDKLTRWHPRFNVDMVPAIEPELLPQPPIVEKLTTAQEVLDRARSLLTPKMEKALTCAAIKTTTATVVGEDPQAVLSGTSVAMPPTANPVPAVTTSNALKGVSQALLERIRAKEAQKLQAAMTRNPAQEERLLMMSRLQELTRILRNVFVAERKPALIMELACNRMVASYRSSLTTGEMEKHLRLLAELVPDWLTIHPIRKDFYLKLSKSMELNIVQDKLSVRLKEEERL